MRSKRGRLTIRIIGPAGLGKQTHIAIAGAQYDQRMSSNREQAEPVAALIGKMHESVRELELIGYDVCRYLAVADPDTLSISEAFKRARKEVRLGLPPWSTLDESTVNAWFTQASMTFTRRNMYAHWRRQSVLTEYGWVDQMISPRDMMRIVNRNDGADLPDITKGACVLRESGEAIVRGLNFRIREGVYVSHPQLSRRGDWNVLCYWDPDAGTWPSRPTAQELADWYDKLVATAPKEWANWPARRLKNESHIHPEHKERGRAPAPRDRND